MGAASAPIAFAGSLLHGRSRHVCAFFNSDDEEYRVLVPFIKDGFERGDRAVHVINRARRADHVRRLEAAGIDSTAAQRTGQLELRNNAETYLRDVIIGGILQQNPFFVPPDEFLRERGAHRA